jgi:hypothetical protein
VAEGNRRKYEFALLAAIVAVLLAFLLAALERTRADFEAAAVQAEAATLRVELLDRMAHREAVGGPLPAGVNPVDWAGYRPRGYLGELDAPPAARAVWYFDRRAGALIYRFRTGGEARFRLARGAGGALGGFGLQRTDNEG